jgi:hypothetical protein
VLGKRLTHPNNLVIEVSTDNDLGMVVMVFVSDDILSDINHFPYLVLQFLLLTRLDVTVEYLYSVATDLHLLHQIYVPWSHQVEFWNG